MNVHARRCPNGARAVPVRCPYGARTVPVVKIHMIACVASCGGTCLCLVARSRFWAMSHAQTYVFLQRAPYGHRTGTVRALHGHRTGNADGHTLPHDMALASCVWLGWGLGGHSAEAALCRNRPLPKRPLCRNRPLPKRPVPKSGQSEGPRFLCTAAQPENTSKVQVKVRVSFRTSKPGRNNSRRSTQTTTRTRQSPPVSYTHLTLPTILLV